MLVRKRPKSQSGRLVDEAFVEGDRDGQSRVIGKRGGGVDFDAIAGDIEFRVSGARAVSAGENGGANVGAPAGRMMLARADFDGHVPLVAGDIPVELVVIVEKSDGVGDRVIDGDGLDGVVGVGDVDFEFAVVPDAAGIEFEAVAAAVGDVFNAEKERIVQALRREVFDGDGAIQAVPGLELHALSQREKCHRRGSGTAVSNSIPAASAPTAN